MVASAANAAGLGKLVVLSAMGEPFRAEIDLLSSPDPSTLTLRLASPEIYPPLGLRYNPALAGTRLNIQSRANGRHVLEVLSLRPLNEPFVYLLVELESDATRIVRGYTALLDPPGYRAPRPTAAAEYWPAVVPHTAAVVTPAAVRTPAHAPLRNRNPASARPAPRAERVSDADAKTLAAMLERVTALEAAVAQLQRQWEKPAVAAATPPPAAPPVPPPVAAQTAPVAAPPPPIVQANQVSPNQAPAIQVPATQSPLAQKPAAPVESAPLRTSGKDSLLNNALLVLAIGLLILLGGLVYVMWGRPAVQERLAKGQGLISSA